MKYLPGRW